MAYSYLSFDLRAGQSYSDLFRVLAHYKAIMVTESLYKFEIPAPPAALFVDLKNAVEGNQSVRLIHLNFQGGLTETDLSALTPEDLEQIQAVWTWTA